MGKNSSEKQSNLSENSFVQTGSCVSENDPQLLFAIAQEELRKLEIENKIKEANHTIRKCLIFLLSVLSVSWLVFTGYEIRQIAKLHHYLPASVAIAFITTSLGTVVGLWAIGLNYFFYNKK
ncbi:MAG: hypothetical protein J6J74_07360 [Elusimicrobiaceae bacterium]|nr:hypothetical protein [Elusimicrobiaceae bacterium]